MLKIKLGVIKKVIAFLLVGSIVAVLDYYFVYNKKGFPFRPEKKKLECIQGAQQDKTVIEALSLLKKREDKEALAVFEQVLQKDRNNLDALWGKAEVLRRARKYADAEIILNQILNKNPNYTSAIISLAYIRYRYGELDRAHELVSEVLEAGCPDKENLALAYMMLSTINSRRSDKGGVLGKLCYGTRIKGYLLKAKGLAPDLPEVHLGLGTFYLLAPAIAGGNTDKAFEELNLAVKIAPGFATANARLAQAYKKKGDLEKYNFHIKRAKELDPDNEVLKEISRDGS